MSAAPSTVETGPRTGSKLVRATFPHAEEFPAKTWGLWFVTVAVWGLFELLAFAHPSAIVQFLAAIFAGLTIVRMFIFYHDYLHGALFRKSTLGKAFMYAVGFYTLNPPSVWKETHDYHHQNNAKMVGAAIGSYPVVTTRIWRVLKPKDRQAYAIARHPITISLAIFTIFGIGMCISPFRRNPQKHWGGPLALVLHYGALVAIGAAFGWRAALFGFWLPLAVSMLAGAYLFYVQHNFPDIVLKDRREWDYSFAAVRSSSMFDMHPILHWFTGNIGYHHVHHLNHKIPFYRLPEAMDAIPELQDPGRTTFALADIRACLKLKLWDPKQGKMVGWDAIS